jgi:DNA-binding transcriptional ArsR family regulator
VCENGKPNILKAFNDEQVAEIQRRLAAKVIQMMGRKFEEGDWMSIYCKVKKIPERGMEQSAIRYHV